MRRLVAETRLSVDDLVAPLFVREGIDAPVAVPSLPGVVQHTRESLRKEARELAELGIPAVMLFGIPAIKDAEGSGAWADDGIVQVALRDLRMELLDPRGYCPHMAVRVDPVATSARRFGAR